MDMLSKTINPKVLILELESKGDFFVIYNYVRKSIKKFMIIFLIIKDRMKVF